VKNYYAILEVPVGCSLEEVRQAYRRLAQENLDNEAEFEELREAYEALTNPAKRAEYDLANWGENFNSNASEAAVSLAATALLERIGRCPMGAEENCPVLQMRVSPSDKFCPECGYLLNAPGNGASDLRIEVEHPTIRLEESGGQIHLLRPGSLVAGRELADVLLVDKTVSRQHARIEISRDGQVSIEDLSSTNGTQVNDEWLVPHIPRAVANGDRIRFGSVLTNLFLSESDPAPIYMAEVEREEPVLLDSADLTPLAKLIEMRETAPDEDPPREFLLAPGITSFGRRAENSVVLLGDPYVSGSHAQIVAVGEQFHLIDVGSTNGTLINGERLTVNEPVLLSAGDMVVIGGTALRFEPLSAQDSVAETMVDAVALPEEAVAAPAAPVEG